MTNHLRRGRLRLYLGAAPGVGTTHAMLSEGRRRRERGTDVVVGAVETHGREPLRALLEGLEDLSGPGVDVAAILRRRPAVALVDDLARASGSEDGDRQRWHDVGELLGAGIDVVSTVDIAEIDSLTDVVRSITGRAPTDTVPDQVVRQADQIELVDMTPEALRRRLAHGNIFPPDEVDAALSDYFRVGNLAALRELALLWLADRVDERLDTYRSEHDIDAVWPTRERVVVALTAGPESDVLLRRAARIAARGAGGELHAVYVSVSRSADAVGEVARLRMLTEELGGKHHTVVAADPAEGVLQFARSVSATQVVVGVSKRPRWRARLRAGVSERIIAGSGDIDVLVITRPLSDSKHSVPRRRGALGVPRMVAGWVLAVAGPITLSMVLIPTSDLPTLALEAMSFLALTVACALVGGLWPAVTAALAGSLLLNWFFTPPERTLTIADTVNVVALALFLLVAVAVASVVDKAARRSLAAADANREANLLTVLNRTMLQSTGDVHALLELVRETFSVDAASLLAHQPEGGWRVVARAGVDAPESPEAADSTTDVGTTGLLLTLRGAPLPAQDHRVLSAFGTHLAAALERQKLARRASEAALLEEGNRVRTALLAAVSHDLRTPLANVKAAVSSLRSPDVQWTPTDERELLATIEDSADRLHVIVANLLDLSRLQADAVRPLTREVGLDDVVARTVAASGDSASVQLRVAPDLPPVYSDAGLLDRIVANLLDNALKHAPAGVPVLVTLSHSTDHVQLRVIDRGPGVSEAEKAKMFAAFQRLGDRQGSEGLGLGLAVAKGLAEALGGSLYAEDTPGGGLTMVLNLPPATRPEPAASHPAVRA